MTSYFSSDYNAVNLLRNGGLDFVKSGASEIPFWEIKGAKLNAVPPENSYEVVVRNTQESENGAARYFRFLLSSDDPVILTQEFSDRFIQMGFVEEVGDPWHEFDVTRVPKRYDVFDCLLVRSTPVTLAFSLRVPDGRVSLKLVAVPGEGSDIESEIQSRVTTKDWIRPTRNADFGYKRIRKIQIVLTRDAGAGSTEVHVGALMMAPGVSSSLPYTGDPTADAFPENMIVMAFGAACPPGFERLDFTAPPEVGRVFPKGGEYSSLDVSGEETHDHDEARVTMNPERNWPKVEMIPADDSGTVRGDNGAVEHDHPKDSALHVPPTKDVILCKRISWNQDE